MVIEDDPKIEEFIQSLVDAMSTVIVVRDDLRHALGDVVRASYEQGFKQGCNAILKEVNEKGYVKLH